MMYTIYNHIAVIREYDAE